MQISSIRNGLLVFMSMLFLSLPVQADLALKFVVYTADKPSSVVRQFRPVLIELESLLEKRFGAPVHIQLKIASSYAEGIRRLETGQVDFGRLGPASYVELKANEPNVSILAMESKKGRKQYNGIICVARDGPITKAKELKGKAFAFGDERSTIGRYLSQNYLLRQGIRATDLARYHYLGRHDKVGSAVGAGLFDAGALKESTFKRLVAKGVPIREIASFPNVTKPWVARSGLEPRIFTALSESLLEVDDAGALKALGKSGFVGGADTDFAVIRKSMEENPQFFGNQSKEDQNVSEKDI